jgi:hypothetical protein
VGGLNHAATIHILQTTSNSKCLCTFGTISRVQIYKMAPIYKFNKVGMTKSNLLGLCLDYTFFKEFFIVFIVIVFIKCVNYHW